MDFRSDISVVLVICDRLPVNCEVFLKFALVNVQGNKISEHLFRSTLFLFAEGLPEGGIDL